MKKPPCQRSPEKRKRGTRISKEKAHARLASRDCTLVVLHEWHMITACLFRPTIIHDWAIYCRVMTSGILLDGARQGVARLISFAMYYCFGPT